MELKSTFGITGEYRFLTFKKGQLDQWLKNKNEEKPQPLRVSNWIKNTVVLNNTNGLNIVIRRLAGDNSLSLGISVASIGTGDTAPTVNDTDLETPITEDIAVALIENTVSTVTTQFFISDTDLPDGTYKEFGIFVNAASKKLFARSIITPSYSKSAGEDSLVEYVITATSI